jgi:hypothetical protein
MALNEHSREDLLGVATSYVRRMLLSVKGLEFRGRPVSELFCGQRKAGQWSLYYDQWLVIQFDSLQMLRRLYIEPDRYAASGGRFAELRRPNKGGKINFQTQFLSALEQAHLIDELQQLMSQTLLCFSHSSNEPHSAIVGFVCDNQAEFWQALIKLLSGCQQLFQVSKLTTGNFISD